MSETDVAPLDTATLDYILRIDPVLEFGGVFAYDQIPKKVSKYPRGYVFNTDRSDQSGTHWVSVYFDNQRNGQYFCPLGTEPYGALYDFVNDNCNKGVYNKSMVQFPLSSMCGYYCIYHLTRAARGFSISDTIKPFRLRNRHTNDRKVFEAVRRQTMKHQSMKNKKKTFSIKKKKKKKKETIRT